MTEDRTSIFGAKWDSSSSGCDSLEWFEDWQIFGIKGSAEAGTQVSRSLGSSASIYCSMCSKVNELQIYCCCCVWFIERSWCKSLSQSIVNERAKNIITIMWEKKSLKKRRGEIRCNRYHSQQVREKREEKITWEEIGAAGYIKAMRDLLNTSALYIVAGEESNDCWLGSGTNKVLFWRSC